MEVPRRPPLFCSLPFTLHQSQYLILNQSITLIHLHHFSSLSLLPPSLFLSFIQSVSLAFDLHSTSLFYLPVYHFFTCLFSEIFVFLSFSFTSYFLYSSLYFILFFSLYSSFFPVFFPSTLLPSLSHSLLIFPFCFLSPFCSLILPFLYTSLLFFLLRSLSPCSSSSLLPLPLATPSSRLLLSSEWQLASFPSLHGARLLFFPFPTFSVFLFIFLLLIFTLYSSSPSLISISSSSSSSFVIVPKSCFVRASFVINYIFSFIYSMFALPSFLIHLPSSLFVPLSFPPAV